MTSPSEDEWRQISDRIIAAVSAAPPSDQLKIFKQQLSLLPADKRVMVEHFVSLTIIFSGHEADIRVKMSKNNHLSFAGIITFIAFLILVVGGIYLVSIADDDAMSKINIMGAAVETSSVGVACFALAALLFIFTMRSVIQKL